MVGRGGIGFRKLDDGLEGGLVLLPGIGTSVCKSVSKEIGLNAQEYIIVCKKERRSILFTSPSNIIASVGAYVGPFPTLVVGVCSCCR